MFLSYAGGFAETVTELTDYEKAGLGIVFVPEAYSFDAVSQLGYLAAKTERVQIASGIFQLYSRTPALTATTRSLVASAECHSVRKKGGGQSKSAKFSVA